MANKKYTPYTFKQVKYYFGFITLTGLLLVLSTAIIKIQQTTPSPNIKASSNREIGAFQIAATDASFTNIANPNQPYPNSSKLMAVNGPIFSQKQKIIFTQFDLTKLPRDITGDTILRLSITDPSSNEFAIYYASDSSWTSNTLTYSSMKLEPGELLASAKYYQEPKDVYIKLPQIFRERFRDQKITLYITSPDTTNTDELHISNQKNKQPTLLFYYRPITPPSVEIISPKNNSDVTQGFDIEFQTLGWEIDCTNNQLLVSVQGKTGPICTKELPIGQLNPGKYEFKLNPWDVNTNQSFGIGETLQVTSK